MSMFVWIADTILQFLEIRSSWASGGTGAGTQPSEPGSSAGASGTVDDPNKYPHY